MNRHALRHASLDSFVSRPGFLLLLLLLLSLSALACPPPAQVVQTDEMQLMRPDTSAIVVLYSRSGNTAQAGRALSESLQADYLRLQGQEGDGDSYIGVPEPDEIVLVTPATYDFSPYQLVLIGSPIWWYAPTAHVNTFVAANDLQGANVVLFCTYGGNADEEELQAWYDLVQAHGGRVRDCFCIDEGNVAEGETIGSVAARVAASSAESWRSTETDTPWMGCRDVQ